MSQMSDDLQKRSGQGTPAAASATANKGPSGAPANPKHCELGDLIHQMNPYSQIMEFCCYPAPPGSGTGDFPKFQVEVDDYEGEWTFKNQVQRVVRAVRVTYRYPMLGKDGKPNGLWATEHLLLGYAGGNGN
jgi:hypothetical protein